MYYSIHSLQLLERFFPDAWIIGLASRIEFIMFYTFFLKTIVFFLYSMIIATLYQKRVSPARYAIASAVFSLVSITPIFATFLALPEAITYRFEVFFVVDPPYFVPLMYLLCTYLLKIDKDIVLIIVMKLYLVVIATVVAYYTLEALFAYLLSNEVPYIQTAFFAANIAMLLVNIVLMVTVLPMIRRRKLWLDAYKLRQSVERSVPRTLGVYTLYGTMIYAPSAILVKFFGQQQNIVYIVVGQLVLIALCGTCFMISYWHDMRRISIVDMLNKDVYIHSLVSSIDENRKLWHDMNNMLQVYDGYIRVGDIDKLKAYHESLYAETRSANDMMDLSTRYESNPALFSVLTAKIAKAKQEGIHLSITCTADASHIGVEPRDLSRIVGILLDNAIEETMVSPTKTIFFSLEEARNNRILLSLTNPTNGDVDIKRIMEKSYTTKENHEGYGLHNLWTIVRRNDNCRFNAEYANRRITFYVELPRISPAPADKNAAPVATA